MGRVALVSAVWFVFWIAAGAALNYWLAGQHGGKENAIYFGGIYGAVFAFVASFAWPWILPRFVQDWMDRRR
jgi:hypothetical protein